MNTSIYQSFGDGGGGGGGGGAGWESISKMNGLITPTSTYGNTILIRTTLTPLADTGWSGPGISPTSPGVPPGLVKFAPSGGSSSLHYNRKLITLLMLMLLI